MMLSVKALLFALVCNHVGQSIAAFGGPGLMYIGTRAMSEKEKDLVVKAGTLIQSRNSDVHHIGKGVYVGNSGDAHAHEGSEEVAVIHAPEGEWPKVPKIWIPKEHWELLPASDDSYAVKEALVAAEQLEYFVADEVDSPSQTVRLSYEAGAPEEYLQMLIPNEMLTHDVDGVALPQQPAEKLNLRVEFVTPSNKVPQDRVKYEEWEGKGHKEFTEETTMNRVKELVKKAEEAAESARGLQSGSPEAMKSVADVVAVTRRCGEGIGHLYREMPSWVKYDQFKLAHKAYTDMREMQATFRKTDLESKVQTLRDRVEKTKGLDDKESKISETQQTLEETQKLLEKAEVELSEYAVTWSKLDSIKDLIDGGDDLEYKNALAEAPGAVWAKLQESFMTMRGQEIPSLEGAVQDEAVIAEKEHSILAEGVENVKTAVSEMEEEVRLLCAGRKRGLCDFMSNRPGGGKKQQDKPKKGQAGEDNNKPKGPQSDEEKSKEAQPGDEEKSKNGQPAESDPDDKMQSDEVKKGDSKVAESQVEQMSEKFAEEEFTHLASKYGLELTTRAGASISFSSIKAQFREYTTLTPKGLSRLGKTGGGILIAGQVAFWVKDVIKTFTHNTTSWERAAVVSSIVPVGGCVVQGVAHEMAGDETLAEVADQVVCATADAILFTPAWPIGLVLHALRPLLHHEYWDAKELYDDIVNPDKLLRRYRGEWEKHREKVVRGFQSADMVRFIKHEWQSQLLGGVFSASRVAGALRAGAWEAGVENGTAADAAAAKNSTSSPGEFAGSEELDAETCNALSLKRRDLLASLQKDIKDRFEEQYAQFDCLFIDSVTSFWDEQKSQYYYTPEQLGPHLDKFKKAHAREDGPGMKPGPEYDHLLSAIRKTVSDNMPLPSACAGKVSPQTRICVEDALQAPCQDIETPVESCVKLPTEPDAAGARLIYSLSPNEGSGKCTFFKNADCAGNGADVFDTAFPGVDLKHDQGLADFRDHVFSARCAGGEADTAQFADFASCGAEVCPKVKICVDEGLGGPCEDIDAPDGSCVNSPTADDAPGARLVASLQPNEGVGNCTFYAEPDCSGSTFDASSRDTVNLQGEARLRGFKDRVFSLQCNAAPVKQAPSPAEGAKNGAKPKPAEPGKCPSKLGKGFLAGSGKGDDMRPLL